jgi:multidrug efflux pump subunit AcrA (membrane-fusion protein)
MTMISASTIKAALLRKSVVALVATLLTLVGAGAVWLQGSEDSTETFKVRRGDIIEAVYGLGTVTANQSYQVKLGVTGTITGLFVAEGDRVERGKTLVTIDQGAFFAAPFSGTVTSVPYKLGETVYAQAPIVTLINLKDRYIVVSLEQESALRVHAGQNARISFETLRGQTYQGKVRAIYPDPQNSQFFVRIDVPNLPESILPGMTSDVAIEIAQRAGALLVPVSAVQSGRVIVRNGHLKKKLQIEIGAIDGRWAEVTGGDLHEGDDVILPGK